MTLRLSAWAVLSFLLTSTARGAPVTFSYAAEVTNLSGDAATRYAGATSVTGAYTFDSDAGPFAGGYISSGMPYGLTADILGDSFVSDGVLIGVVNDIVDFDRYVVIGFGNVSMPPGLLPPILPPHPPTFLPPNTFFVLDLQATNGLAITSAALPLVPPDVSLFDSRRLSFVYRTTDGNLGQVDTEVTAITAAPATVPEPSTLLLTALGLGGLAYQRNRRTRL
jgi:hypothetical protein